MGTAIGRIGAKPARERGPAGPADARARSAMSIRAGLLPWVPVWMSVGIGIWLGLPYEPGVPTYAALALVVLGAGLAAVQTIRLAESGRIDWRWCERLRLVCIAMLLVALGAALAGARSHLVAAPILDFRYYGGVEGRVVEIDRSSRDRIRLTLDQIMLDNVSPAKLPERVRISLFQPDPLPVPGQRVMLTAHLGPPSGPVEPGGFDFRRVAWFERLGAIGYSRTPVLTLEPPQPGGGLAIHRLRMRLSAAIQDTIGGQAGAISSAMLTGDRSGINAQTNEIMRASNLYHIISISGLHMSMLAGFVYAVLRMIGVGALGAAGRYSGHAHKFAALAALLAAGFYLALSGTDVAATRSFIMVAVMLLAIIVDRRAISLRTVAVAAVVILAVTPEALASAGFQMSFAATIALILANEPWQRVSSRLPAWFRPVAMLVVSSLVASLATAPIAAAHFGRLSQYGMIANLLVVPVMGMIVMPAGAISALLGLVGLADLPLWFVGLGTRWMLIVADFVANLGGAAVALRSPPSYVLPLAGMSALLLFLSPIRRGDGDVLVSFARRMAGIVGLLAASGMWLISERPQILISAGGDAVGVMTSDGRVLSKATGGAFSVAEWLQADGDMANQEMSSQRSLWTGGKNLREARIATQWGNIRIVHGAGKGAEAIVQPVCQAGTIIVSSAAFKTFGKRGAACTVLDAALLRKTGAVSVVPMSQGFAMVTVDQGRMRAWTYSSGMVKTSGKGETIVRPSDSFVPYE